jgi:hypothetical protein
MGLNLFRAHVARAGDITLVVGALIVVVALVPWRGSGDMVPR